MRRGLHVVVKVHNSSELSMSHGTYQRCLLSGSWDGWQLRLACKRVSDQRVEVAAPGSGVRRRDAMWHMPYTNPQCR